jgi:hypothetical protein
MKAIRIMNYGMTAIGYFAVLVVVVLIIILNRTDYSICLEPRPRLDAMMREITVRDDSGESTSRMFFPMEVFARPGMPTWQPGEPLPLDPNEALKIANDQFEEAYPHLRGVKPMRQSLTLRSVLVSDDRTDWYYDYDGYRMSPQRPPSRSFSVWILMDGTIWEPQNK